jgi:hypothetical protein
VAAAAPPGLQGAVTADGVTLVNKGGAAQRNNSRALFILARVRA